MGYFVALLMPASTTAFITPQFEKNRMSPALSGCSD